MATKDKPNDTDKLKDKRTDKERATDEQLRNYGFGQNARLDTAREVTEEQEYAADGLPRTQKYSVDKVGRNHDELDAQR